MVLSLEHDRTRLRLKVFIKEVDAKQMMKEAKEKEDDEDRAWLLCGKNMRELLEELWIMKFEDPETGLKFSEGADSVTHSKRLALYKKWDTIEDRQRELLAGRKTDLGWWHRLRGNQTLVAAIKQARKEAEDEIDEENEEGEEEGGEASEKKRQIRDTFVRLRKTPHFRRPLRRRMKTGRKRRRKRSRRRRMRTEKKREERRARRRDKEQERDPEKRKRERKRERD